MSYCRWSSDNWRCDLYCYADVSGGYTTHVAGNRIVGEVPPAPLSLIIDGETEEFMLAHRKQMDYLDKAEHAPIGLPFDKETFNDPDLPSFLDRLLEMRKIGYQFPDYVLEEVREEIKLGVL